MRILPFIFGRILGALPTLFVVITVAFFLMRLAPGGPFSQERALTPEIEANLKAAYGLDKPLFGQYLAYLSGVVRGELGPSFKYPGFTVQELIAQGIPVSFKLGISALIMALILGVGLGTVAALYHNRWPDRLVMSLSVVGIVVPNFVVAPLLSLVFGVYFRLLPVGGWEGGRLENMVLPVTALALPYVAYIARLNRAAMVELLNSSFIRTARAKGLGGHRIILRHALQPALVPVVSYLGPATAGLIAGSVVIETIFGLPGIGRYFVIGALNRDYTLVMGVVIFYASLIIVLNLLVDIVYHKLDPRMSY